MALISEKRSYIYIYILSLKIKSTDPERRGYIKGMDKRLKGYAENCMKLLETLDGLQINNDNTEEEQVIFFSPTKKKEL